MYDQIVDGILREFPMLMQESGIPLQSVRVYWREKLKYKWQNERKSKDKNLPEVKAKKRKVTTELKDDIPKAKKNLTWGMSNYLPMRPDSEDLESIKLHKTWLKQEYRKVDQDFRLVDLKMGLTFPDRRKDIVQDGNSLSEIIKEYPFLQDRRQLLQEFARLGPNTEKKELEDLFFDGLDSYREVIVKLSKGKKLHKFEKEIYDLIAVQRSDDQRKYTSQCAAILGIALLLKEKFNQVLYFSDSEETEEPFLLIIKDRILSMGNDLFELKVDGDVIFRCDTFLELITGLIASIYCFNLVYPKPIEKSLLFIQNCIMSLNDGGKVDKKILSVITELNREKTKTLN
ncbi:uncharacterized protein LOC127714725 [Mytilus californianus]|uniref:uncharacterized protein LOC127714725 n=1 Tax=Mytilus californianus TaxID=6549 RepID=UPI002247F3DB|nr:uncharacterized protein LOC127714725 [Mytilus californianus]XP_052076739.1 uncharacterized protein LOC127714725 [Mytilus californianus]